MTGNGNLQWAYDDQTLAQVSKQMFENGYNQMPVRTRENPHPIGIVTDLSILKAIMGRGQNKANSIAQLAETTITKADVIESLLECPADSPLIEAANILTDYPAVLLTSKTDIIGILTRADLLKTLNQTL